jgi:hypothetical protein
MYHKIKVACLQIRKKWFQCNQIIKKSNARPIYSLKLGYKIIHSKSTEQMKIVQKNRNRNTPLKPISRVNFSVLRFAEHLKRLETLKVDSQSKA